MTIDRNNYESYFILYLDNELSQAERQEVEKFAAAHPDLQEELLLLGQTKFVADEHIEYGGKEELMRTESAGEINFTNYEEWLLLYIDGELLPAERSMVEGFAAEHASVGEELSVLRQTIVRPETIVFPDKSLLYRKEEKKVRPVFWWRMAAAAVLAGVVVSTVFVVMKKENGSVPVGKESVANLPAMNTRKINTIPEKNNVVVPEQEMPQEEAEVKMPVYEGLKKELENVVEKKVKKIEVPEEAPVLAKVVENAPMVNHFVEENRTIAVVDEKKSSQQNSNISDVTPEYARTYNTADASPSEDDSDITYANTAKKSKFRGFLRKITRTVEKQTNIDATDDDDRLLVGGLAIKL